MQNQKQKWKKRTKNQNKYVFNRMQSGVQYLLLMFHPLLKYIRFCKSTNIFPFLFLIRATLSILCVVYTFFLHLLLYSNIEVFTWKKLISKLHNPSAQ